MAQGSRTYWIELPFVLTALSAFVAGMRNGRLMATDGLCALLATELPIRRPVNQFNNKLSYI